MARRDAFKSDPSIQQYLQEIKKYELLSAKEERSLARAARKGDAEARDHMIRSNLRLVVSIAKKFMRPGLSFSDLIEEGNLGLLRAVEGFKPSAGCRFSTYATWWIRQTIRRSLTNTVRTIRIPAYMVEMIARFKAVSNRLQTRLSRVPTLEEIAEEMDLRPQKVNMIRRAIRAGATRASGETSEDATWVLGDLVRDEKAKSPEEELFDVWERERIQALLDAIDDREATILRLRYGFEGGEPMTLKRIGERLGITRERVRQIEKAALQKLNAKLTEEEPE